MQRVSFSGPVKARRPPRGGVSRNYVSTIGVKRDKNAGGIWFAGMDEAIKRLRPSHVVCYGSEYKTVL